MPKSQQRDKDVQRLATEVDRDERKIRADIDALESRVDAVEFYLSDTLLLYLTQLATVVPFAPPPAPPWA